MPRAWVLPASALAAFVLLGIACAARHEPAATVRAFGDHLAGLRCGEAYDLMSLDYRRQHRREEFLRLCRESPGDVREGARRLRASTVTLAQAAEVEYGAGGRLQLVLEDGSWRIASDPLGFYAQGSPREALRSFLRAVAAKRYDRVLPLVPRKWREHMSEAKLRGELEGPRRQEIDSLVRNLVAHVNAQISEHGDEARMPYGEGAEVKFVREEGKWTIADLD